MPVVSISPLEKERAGFRNIRRSTTGLAVRSERSAKAVMAAALSGSSRTTRGDVQPEAEPRFNPRAIRTSAANNSAVPMKSVRLSAVARTLWRKPTARTNPASARGARTQKMERHPNVSRSSPPSAWPAISPKPATEAISPSALPRSLAGKAFDTSPSESETIIAAPTPCSARSAISARMPSAAAALARLTV